ncbi:DUF1129 family protein [Fructilactobacillus vespulae]|uniref:DUF1129 family protein n=1 Tax=Fructilactobacillus vespulae TaxID=1249630 RepID=UPI0039B471A3
MSETENRKRNAHVQQKRNNGRKQLYEQLDAQGLSKKNVEYLTRFREALAETKMIADKQNDIFAETIVEVLAGQKQGKTARGMYGTVAEKVENIVNPPAKPVGPMTKERYLIDASYNVLWFMILFMFMYAAMFFMAPDQAKQGGVAGITSIILSSIIAGAGMPVVTQLFAPGVKHKYNAFIRLLLMIVAFAAWMVIFYSSNALPRVINPVVSPIINIIIGALAVVGVIYMRAKYTITSGLFTGRR